MQPYPLQIQEKVDRRIRSLRILFFALLMSLVSYFIFTRFLLQPRDRAPNNLLSLVLAIAAFSTTLISIPIKSKVLSRAIQQQSDVIVQQGYIVAWALCEASALLGVVDFIITGNKYYFVLFIIAGIGDLINFPKRQDVLDACYRDPTYRS
jgi:hypothetical protein